MILQPLNLESLGWSHYRVLKLPQELLARLNLKPEEINRVVVSHGHFDHLNGIVLFPKARIYMQKALYEAVLAGPRYAFYRQMGLRPLRGRIEN